MIDEVQTGDICCIAGDPSGVLVEIVQDCWVRLPNGDVRWNPLIDESWKVRVLTGPEEGLTKTAWCYTLYRPSALTILATADL